MCIRFPLVWVSSNLAVVLFSHSLARWNQKCFHWSDLKLVRIFTNSVTWLSLPRRSQLRPISLCSWICIIEQSAKNNEHTWANGNDSSHFSVSLRWKKRKEKIAKSFDTICSQRHRDIFSPVKSRSWWCRDILCDNFWLAFISTSSLCTSGAKRKCHAALLPAPSWLYDFSFLHPVCLSRCL